MKGTKGSLVSLSFVFITENGKLDENAKRIIFPSNYDSLMKSVNKLFEKKFVVRSIYTSDGILVSSTNDINPGDILIVSPNEAPDIKAENQSKTLDLYDDSNGASNQNYKNENRFNRDNNKNQMSKERRQTYNHLFGLTSQKTSSNRSRSKQSKNNLKSTNSTGRKDKSNTHSKTRKNNKQNSDFTDDNNQLNSQLNNQLNNQREKSFESFNSTNENQKQSQKALSNAGSMSNMENASYEDFNNNGSVASSKSSVKNRRKDKNTIDNDKNQQNKHVVHQLPSNLYSNLDNANFDNPEQWDDENYYNQDNQIIKSEEYYQENHFYENNNNPNEEDNSSNLRNANKNDKYYYEDTSEARDGDSYFKNSYYGDNEEDETNLCQISKEILNEESFAQNIKSSLRLLDDNVMSKFLRTGQTLEDNQRNYWFLRYLKYFEEQKIGQHGNYMYAYDSMTQYAKNFIGSHRFIIYPISSFSRNQKSRNNNNTTNISNTNNNNNAEDSSTATNNNKIKFNSNQIHYNIRTKAAICGPRKSGKTTLLSIIAEQLLTEIAINGFWKNTVIYCLDMEDCGPIFDDFKALYIFFIEFSLKAIVLQRPELTPHLSMLVKFFGSIFEFTNAPKLKKIFSSKPQFQKFSLNCEDLVIFFSRLWNNNETHILFYTSIFQIPSLLANAAGLTNIFLFVDNVEYAQAFVHDDLDFGQEINVYDVFSLLLERVNYIITCEEQLEMFDCLDSKTELISTFQLNAQTQYPEKQLIVKYEFEQSEKETANIGKRRRYENELSISQPQQMILTASYCGEIPAFVCLWDEINSIADEIDDANEKLDNEMMNKTEEEEDFNNDEKVNAIEEMEEVLFSLVQNFINDMVIDNEQGAKIRVVDVRRTSK